MKKMVGIFLLIFVFSLKVIPGQFDGKLRRKVSIVSLGVNCFNVDSSEQHSFPSIFNDRSGTSDRSCTHSRRRVRRQTVYDRHGIPMGKADLAYDPRGLVKKRRGFLSMPDSDDLTTEICALQSSLALSKQEVTNKRNAFRLALSKHQKYEKVVLPKIEKLRSKRDRRKSYRERRAQRRDTLDASWGY